MIRGLLAGQATLGSVDSTARQLQNGSLNRGNKKDLDDN